MPTRWSHALWVVGFLCASMSVSWLLAAETPPTGAPDPLPKVITSDLSPEEKTDANEAGLPMPLSVHLELPKEGWRYEGYYRMSGDGPLGPMTSKAKTNLAIAPGEAWPVKATLVIMITGAWQQDSDGKWVMAKPPAAAVPPVAMDQMGRTTGNYNPGEAPLSYLGDLWPLPPEPLDLGDRYVEAVKTVPQEGDPFAFEGTREISLVSTQVVDGVPCAAFTIRTNLDAKPLAPGDQSVLKVEILSYATFDTRTGQPVEASQQAKWSGHVDGGDGALREVNWEMTWSLERITHMVDKPAKAEKADESAEAK